jgi:3-hydroxybutyryl-CoA dehydratase
MESPPLAPGTKVTCSKTVTESDVYLFAGITGDFSPNHVDEVFMKKSAYGRRVAHGALIVGYMSRASSMILERAPASREGYTPVSLGYDKVRFLKPVFIGDTITITYLIQRTDAAKHRTIAKVEATNERSELVAVADHIMQWVTA